MSNALDIYTYPWEIVDDYPGYSVRTIGHGAHQIAYCRDRVSAGRILAEHEACRRVRHGRLRNLTRALEVLHQLADAPPPDGPAALLVLRCDLLPLARKLFGSEKMNATS